MADFPVVKTNAIPDVTPIQAKHINDLEDKVGISGSVDPASLDNRVAVVETQVNVDHDASGHHKAGAWHIVPPSSSVLTVVTSDAGELNRLDGVGPTVTAPNLTSLTDGSTLGVGVLHTHGIPGGTIVFMAVPYPLILSSGAIPAFIDINVGGYVPVGTKAVMLQVRIYGDDGGAYAWAELYALFRKKGDTTTGAISLPGLSTTVVHLANQGSRIGASRGTLFVEVDTNRIFQVLFDSTAALITKQIDVSIIGYVI